MLFYVTLGSHDVAANSAFYDKVLGTIGMVRLTTEAKETGYGPKGGETCLWVLRPQNGLPASWGNGTMIAFHAPSRAAVDAFHAAALSAGGYDEGKPGIRGGADSNWYACYVRDLSGNKLSAIYNKPA